MERHWYKTLVGLMWLALPITALKYWRAWDQLPARMAVHFDANWQPNGYTSREGALMLGLGIMAFMLVCFYDRLARRARPEAHGRMAAARGLLCDAWFFVVREQLDC